MSASAAVRPRTQSRLFDAQWRHRLRWRTAALIAVSFLVALALEGYSFYSLPPAERVHHEAYDLYRPSGELGLKLGIAGGVLFLLIYLYPIRKRWPWLRKIGNTKHWLDFHILMGLVGARADQFPQQLQVPWPGRHGLLDHVGGGPERGRRQVLLLQDSASAERRRDELARDRGRPDRDRPEIGRAGSDSRRGPGGSNPPAVVGGCPAHVDAASAGDDDPPRPRAPLPSQPSAPKRDERAYTHHQPRRSVAARQPGPRGGDPRRAAAGLAVDEDPLLGQDAEAIPPVARRPSAFQLFLPRVGARAHRIRG